MTRPTLAEIIGVITGENTTTWLPGIRKYTFTLEDLDGEGTTRDEVGTLHREVLRANVLHVTATHIVDQSELISITSLIKADSTVDISLFCPGRGNPYDDGTFYVSKLTADLVRLKDPATGNVADWWQVDYTLVEV